MEHYAKSGVGDDVFDSIEKDVLEDETLAYLTTGSLMDQAEYDALENDMEEEFNETPLAVNLDISGEDYNNVDENYNDNMIISPGLLF